MNRKLRRVREREDWTEERRRAARLGPNPTDDGLVEHYAHEMLLRVVQATLQEIRGGSRRGVAVRDLPHLEMPSHLRRRAEARARELLPVVLADMGLPIDAISFEDPAKPKGPPIPEA